jgi:phage-related protein
VEVPGRAGSWVFPEEAGDRTLTVDIDIGAASFASRRAAVVSLANWADVVAAPVQLIVDDQPDRYHEVVLASAPDVTEWLITGAVVLEYRAGPFALAVSTSSNSVTATTGSGSGTYSATLDTGLTAEPVVVVTARGGTMTSLTFTLNNASLSWTGLVNANGSITISTISSTITTGANSDVNLTGALTVGNLDMAGVSGAFGFIVNGSNAWVATYTGTATTVELVTTWRRRYR